MGNDADGRCSETCSETVGELARLKGEWWGKPNWDETLALSSFPLVFNALRKSILGA